MLARLHSVHYSNPGCTRWLFNVGPTNWKYILPSCLLTDNVLDLSAVMMLQHQRAGVIQTRNAASPETLTTPATKTLIYKWLNDRSVFNWSANYVINVNIQSNNKFKNRWETRQLTASKQQECTMVPQMWHNMLHSTDSKWVGCMV